MSIIAKVLLVTLLLPACAYRFTNRHIQLPSGVKTMAVEAIYDTTREVFPHEVLWESLQRAFAADGHLQLVSQGRADVLLRAHIIQGSIDPAGSVTTIKPEVDLKASSNPANIPNPDQFRVLTQAGEFTTKERMQILVNVEIIDLNTRQTIFRKNYTGAEVFTSSRTDEVAQQKSHYLLYEESLKSDFKRIADRVSSEVVRDFVVGR